MSATRRLSSRVTVLAVALTIALTACDTLENVVVPIADAVASTGQLTVWTTDPSPSPIEVMLNGSSIGVLTAYRTTAPACGAANSAGVITVTRPVGTHALTARETQANGVWPRMDVQLTAGGCQLITLNP